MPRWTTSPAIGYLAAALAVEGSDVEHDLGLAVAGQLLVFHAVAQDGDDARLGLDSLVAEEPRLAGAALDRLVDVAQLGVPGQIRLRALAAAFLLLGHRGDEARAIDANAVLRGHIHGEIHREPVRVVQAERDFAGERRRILGQALGPPADDPLRLLAGDLRPGQRREGHLELARAGFEGPVELRFFLANDLEDLLALLGQVRVGVLHDVDHHARRHVYEGLAAAEEPAVPDRSPKDAPQDVAAALVGGRDAVRHEEGHRARMVGDDLVAEPLRLEGLRVVAQEIAHRGVDRRE